MAGAAFGLYVSVLFRPPNNPYVAQKVFDFAAPAWVSWCRLMPARLLRWRASLEAGQGVGVLVDQKFRKGLNTKFFGLDAKTNPLLGKLVRQFNCEVYQRAASGCRATAIGWKSSRRLRCLGMPAAISIWSRRRRLLNDKVESWVREYPEQWLWYHDRWKIKRRRAVGRRRSLHLIIEKEGMRSLNMNVRHVTDYHQERVARRRRFQLP